MPKNQQYIGQKMKDLDKKLNIISDDSEFDFNY